MPPFSSRRLAISGNYRKSTVPRAVERNPVRAKLVDSAKRWPFGSLYRWNQTREPVPTVLSPWPMRSFPNWNRRVDAAFSAKELAEVRTCVERGRPFGDPAWVENIADRHSRWHTLRPPGRPRKPKSPK
jgi:putative transposase